MPYTQLLNQLIDQSGLTAKEIAERCKQHGQEITASYVSILRKEANERIPSFEVSQALEAVLDAPKDLLVLEGYPRLFRTAAICERALYTRCSCVVDKRESPGRR